MSTPFRFSSYTDTELDACGAAFRDDIVRNAPFATLSDTRVWTDYVLEWFACAVPLAPHFVVTYSHRPRGNFPWRSLFPGSEIAARIPGPQSGSEFLLDLSHVELGISNLQLGDAFAHVPLRVRLGLESEWGHSTSPAYTLDHVWTDAAKLAAVRADVKVLVFASNSAANHDDLVRTVEQLRARGGDSAPWLWMDVPWCRDRRMGAWEPSFGVFK